MVDKTIEEISTELTNFLTASVKAYAGKTATDYWFDLATFFQQGRNFTGQAHGGYYDKSFTASATFDADDGNNQRMVCTGDTTIGITNEDPGVFIFDLPISGSGVSAITIGASFGQAYPNNDSLAYTDGSINTITLFVNANSDNRYTITAYEA